MTTAAQVRGEGRVTIPKSIRDDLGLEEGDTVLLEIRRIEDVEI